MTHIPWTVNDIVKATGGELISGMQHNRFNGISIDSRTIEQDDLFAAIKGERYDGHAFINQVVEYGVRGVLAAEENVNDISISTLNDKGISVIAVNDTTTALGHLARYHRRRSVSKVVAITGSNGKTTTREMISSVLSEKYTVLAGRGNFNNEFGLPLSLFGLMKNHEWAVLELGMNHPGEILNLSSICEPDVGVITNVGPAHLEGVGSIEGVMNAKGELLENIKSTGRAVLNADDDRVLQLADRSKVDVILYGRASNASVRSENERLIDNEIEFDLILPDDKTKIRINTPASFMVLNALAAGAVGHIAGMNVHQIKAGLESFTPVKGRMNLVKTGDIQIIDDTYNANPGSVAAAMRTFEYLRGKNRGIIVLGDMLELGENAGQLHDEIGSIAAETHAYKLYLTGKYAQKTAEGARRKGMSSKSTIVGTRKEIIEKLNNELQKNDWILVKGSRAMCMENVVHAIRRKNETSLKRF